MVARLLSDAGVTTILVTHDQSEALSFADQLAVMRQGRLVHRAINGAVPVPHR
jgi:iron(III) transport system ATP-binding protein